MLARIPRLGDLAMTTNGSALARKARALGDAGLRRITVSLDSLDNEVFAAVNDVGFPVERVLAGIEAAAAAGLGPIKINMVVKRGVNEDSVMPMARHFRGSDHIVRFIEYMDVGHSNGWRMDETVPAAEIVAMIDADMPLERVAPNYPGEVVERWRYRDGTGEIERETEGQGNTGTDAVAVGRPGVTVTVGLAVAVTLGVAVGVTVAVTGGAGGGSGAGSTGSRKPLSLD